MSTPLGARDGGSPGERGSPHVTSALPSAAEEARDPRELDARAQALVALNEAGVPFVVAGAYAFFEYTGIFRDTKDLDVFLRRRDLDQALVTLSRAGFRTELLDPVWIAKAWRDPWFVDLIFASGNGLSVVDDAWFDHAVPARVMGAPVLLAPAEEIIWSKAFVCERERFDGHDIAHLLRARGDALDWRRLLDRFDEHWELLLTQLLLFRYVFPVDRGRVPEWVFRELLARAEASLDGPPETDRATRGPLLSKTQYRHLAAPPGPGEATAAAPEP